MRASNLAIVAMTVLLASGCQSMPYQAAPIVGDTMTIGDAGFPISQGPMVWTGDSYIDPSQVAYQGCPYGGCTACGIDGHQNPGCTACDTCPETCDWPYPYSSDQGGDIAPQQQLLGCAGGFCDGRCRGLCRMAHAQRMAMMREKHRQFQEFVASRPVHTHIYNTATRHCEGAVGPQFGAVNYPYYTTRGPRDFFLANPPSIGP